MTVIAVDRDPVTRTLTIVAEFDKPAQRVWQVWADPRQLERWWGPPTYPATVVDHDLTVGGRVTYYMTGPDGEKLHAWWRIVSVDPPRSMTFEEGNTEDAWPNDQAPTTSIEVRLVETAERTTMTITCRFAPIADQEQVPDTGTEEGMRLAVGQIDALLATTAGSDYELTDDRRRTSSCCTRFDRTTDGSHHAHDL